MSEFKHGKYIVTQPKKDLKVPEWGGNLSQETSTRIMYLDSEVIKGAFFVECVWFWPTTKEDKGSPDPHSHEFDEVLGFFGTDTKNVLDLGGEIEFWFDDEQYMLTKSCLVYIPKGLKHCPIVFRRIDRPIFHFLMVTGGEYT